MSTDRGGGLVSKVKTVLRSDCFREVWLNQSKKHWVSASPRPPPPNLVKSFYENFGKNRQTSLVAFQVLRILV